jgi:hypothetical protein
LSSARAAPANEVWSGEGQTFNLPEWMPAALRAARALRATTQGSKGAHHMLYVVLLNDSRRVGHWGLYVGETSRDPDLRFDQHKTGYKASRFVNRFGYAFFRSSSAISIRCAAGKPWSWNPCWRKHSAMPAYPGSREDTERARLVQSARGFPIPGGLALSPGRADAVTRRTARSGR